MMIDHIVYGVADLGEGLDVIERLLGVRPAMGGRHVGAGTHNALLSLGDTTYLELIAPDPDQSVDGPLPFGVTRDMASRLVGWAARTDDIDARVAQARAAGHDPGDVHAMSRTRPDGVRLSWRLTPFPSVGGSFLLPFLIDWGDTPHPAHAAPSGVRLTALHAESPEPETVARQLAALAADIRVERGARPTLVCAIATASGEVQLR